MSLTKLQVQSKYPEVYESYTLQASLPEAKYVEKIKFWEASQINCFERWTIPYFLEREKEKKRPCLRLNYPPDGKCNECTRGTCRYDRICFMCGLEGHGAFQSFPGGKLKGELKCTKHRNFLSQLGMIRLQHGIDEDGLRALFKLPLQAAKKTTAAPAVAAATATTETEASVPENKKKDGSKAPNANQPCNATSKNKSEATSAANANEAPPPVPSPKAASSDQTSPHLASLKGPPAAPWLLNGDNSQQGLNMGLNNTTPGTAPNAFDPIYLGPNSSTTLNGASNSNMEDNGRRLWAGPSLGSTSGDSLAVPAGLPALHSTAGLFNPLSTPLSNPSLSMLSGFDAMGLNSGYNASASMFPLSMNGGAPGPAIQAIELVDSDEFSPHATLRLSLSPASLTRDESNGSYFAKGALITHRGADDVQVRVWRKNASIVDTASLRNEIKALRMLSRKCAHVSKILHLGSVDMSSNPAAPTPVNDLIGIVSETSELGTLDRYTANHIQLQASAAAPTYSTADLQSMCVQLIEGLIQCHEVNIRHRDIRPQNILVSTCTDKYQSRQFGRGLQLKYANFTPVSLLGLCSASENALYAAELDKWVAPEVDAESRKFGVRFQASSDVWSLGLTLYYLATNGSLPFDTHKQAIDAATNPDYRRACLEKHGLQDRLPMLYDLIERLVRPAFMRTDLQIIRCHPFLWGMECKKSMLTSFANACMTRGSDVITNFVSGIDKISPLYVFGAEGWVQPMAPYLLSLVNVKIKTDYWWSGTYLLQAIKHTLQYPETLSSVYARMSVPQATHAYLRQITEVDFPRLLILLYELGGIHGKWVWDGDEVVHTWN